MKKQIIQTSLEQFLKHGIRKMSLQKIVAPLGISTKTVYKHFDNKEALLKESLVLYYDQNFKVLELQVENENVMALMCNIWYGALETELKINQAFFHDLLYYYPELNENFTALSDKRFLKSLTRVIQRGMDDGLFNNDINPKVVLDGLIIIYTAIVRKQHFNKFNLSTLDILLNTLLIYVRGLCTMKGIKEFDEHVETLPNFEKLDDLKKKFNNTLLNLN